jgi:hypothetical protein
MNVTRYIPIQAIKTNDNSLIPIWDPRITFEKTEMYGNQLNFERERFYNTVECVFDIKTKQISIGIDLDYYPKLEYAKDEKILHEVSNRVLGEATIEKIVYEEYELEIIKGKKIENYWKTYFSEVVFLADSLYAIKKWKPFYVLNNGKIIEYSHQLYHKKA